MSAECQHSRITFYSRLASMATLYEPAEYDEHLICDECGLELDDAKDLPAGTIVTDDNGRRLPDLEPDEPELDDDPELEELEADIMAEREAGE